MFKGSLYLNPLYDGLPEWLLRTAINIFPFGRVSDDSSYKPVCFNNTVALTETSGTAASLEVASGLQLSRNRFISLSMKSIHLFGFSECLSLTLTCLDNSMSLYAPIFSDESVPPTHMLWSCLSFPFIQVLPWHALVRHIKEVHVPLVILVVGWHPGGPLGAQFGRGRAGWPGLFVRGGICDFWWLFVRSSGKLGCSILVRWGERKWNKSKDKTQTTSRLQEGFRYLT